MKINHQYEEAWAALAKRNPEKAKLVIAVLDQRAWFSQALSAVEHTSQYEEELEDTNNNYLRAPKPERMD